MSRNLQLIWDFKGPSAAQTAAHHLIHLKEYAEANQVAAIASGTQEIHQNHHVAYIVVAESDMPPVRDALRPHRGKVWNAD